MNLPRLLTVVTLSLFSLIALIALFKKLSSNSEIDSQTIQESIEITLNEETAHSTAPVINVTTSIEPIPSLIIPTSVKLEKDSDPLKEKALPDANRIEEFFNKEPPQLPIVETITYKSHVPWQKGRPAWLTDYASHYTTSRHFIARSLNGKPDYTTQNIIEGNRFNVLRQDKNFEFYLLVDSSRCRLWFYYIDLDLHEKILIKTYPVCLGRVDSSKASGLLTPLGKYKLGDRVATHKPKMMGMHQGKKIEWITVFGTRWIPFEKEIGVCTAPARGFGLHGTPCTVSPTGVIEDHSEGIGKYESDGCIRLENSSIEEIYAIVITKPTIIEITRDFYDSALLKNYPEA